MALDLAILVMVIGLGATPGRWIQRVGNRPNEINSVEPFCLGMCPRGV